MSTMIKTQQLRMPLTNDGAHVFLGDVTVIDGGWPKLRMRCTCGEPAVEQHRIIMDDDADGQTHSSFSHYADRHLTAVLDARRLAAQRF